MLDTLVKPVYRQRKRFQSYFLCIFWGFGGVVVTGREAAIVIGS
jgi:hypothetical protein